MTSINLPSSVASVEEILAMARDAFLHGLNQVEEAQKALKTAQTILGIECDKAKNQPKQEEIAPTPKELGAAQPRVTTKQRKNHTKRKDSILSALSQGEASAKEIILHIQQSQNSTLPISRKEKEAWKACITSLTKGKHPHIRISGTVGNENVYELIVSDSKVVPPGLNP
jgi:hypothetical protein